MSFTDFVKLQTEVAHVLRADADLESVNIITRHQLIENESRLPDKTLALEVLAYITPRNGRKGCGIIVEKPEISVENPNLPGPECFTIITCLILEDRLQNEAPVSGTLKPADQAAQRILELLHGLIIENHGGFYAERNAIQPAPEFDPLVAYKVRLKVRLQRDQTARCATPTITEDAGTITLAVTDDSEIWFTTDESFPARFNPVATQYSAPFTAAAGVVIRWAAYAATRPQSHVGKATVT